jgi:anti-sigma regulatory factor (Ser/Thr protein kinase)
MANISLPAKMENLEKLVQFVSAFAKKSGLAKKRIQELELATEETIVNIINYAYTEDTGTVEVICNVDENGRTIIEILDAGTPFNPLFQAEPSLTDNISDRNIGGLGIFFIRKMMDEVLYRYEHGKNILTLVPFRK